MYTSTKIATCCFCGTRATLVLTADRHELSCSSCGAPLHDLKKLPLDQSGKTTRKPAKPYGGGVTPPDHWERRAKPKKPRKKKKGLAQRFFEEAFDVIEDIFD
jgi:ribosomal protein L34E